MRIRFSKGTLLFFVYLILLIFALELNLRKFEKLPDYQPNVMFAVDFNEDHPHIHKESKIPGLIFELDSNVDSMWQGVSIRTNAMGLRDKEYSIKKPEGTFRIIGLGDSITFGASIDEEDTFLNVLESKLNEGGRGKFEVLNAGISAYNLIQYYILFKNKLIKYDPDLVLVNFYQNDYIPINFLKRYDNFNETYKAGGTYTSEEILAQNLAGFFPFPYNLNYFLLANSALYRFLNIRIYNIASKINPDYFIPGAYKYLNGIQSDKENKQALFDLIELCRDKGIGIVIVVHPFLENSDNNDRWIRTVPRERYGVPTLDLINKYFEEDIDLSEFRINHLDGAHPNVQGNKIIGETIYKFLSEEKLLEESNLRSQ